MPLTTTRLSLISKVRPMACSGSRPGQIWPTVSRSRTIAPGARSDCSVAASMSRGAPMKLRSSRPVTVMPTTRPSSVWAELVAREYGTAHATPSTPRTRNTAWSGRPRGCSTARTRGSITHTCASETLMTGLAERDISQVKMASCWVISRVAKATPNTSPAYLTGSPSSIFSAFESMASRSAGNGPGPVRDAPRPSLYAAHCRMDHHLPRAGLSARPRGG